MSLEDRVRQAFDPLADQLRSDLNSRIAATLDRLNVELETEQTAAVTEAVAEARLAVERDVTAQLTARFDAEREAAVARVEGDVTERLTARFEIERVEAVAAAAHEAAAAAERAVTAQLTEEFEVERVAAVAQAAADAASAAEYATAERLTMQFDAERANTVAQVARETSESVERAVTERLTALHDAERASAVSKATEDTRAKTERETADRLSAEHEAARAAAVSRATDETWARAEQEITERVITNLTARHTHAKTEAEAAELAAGRRIVGAVRALDNCRALSEVLQTLAVSAAAEAARTALLLVEPQRFRGSRSTGFSPDSRELLLSVDPETAGVIAEAARTGQAAVVADGLPAPGFAGLPDDQAAIAVPLVLTGRVVGVLYADQGIEPAIARPTWQAALEILGRHGSRVLEALTAARLAEAATGRSMTSPVAEPETRSHAGQAGSWN